MEASRKALFDQVAARLGHAFDGEMRIGGNYVPAVQNGDEVYVSGQIPRIDNSVKVVGRVGGDVSLEDGRYAARICTMRALAILAQLLGDLQRVKKSCGSTSMCKAPLTSPSRVKSPTRPPKCSIRSLPRPGCTPARPSGSISCQRMPRWKST